MPRRRKKKNEDKDRRAWDGGFYAGWRLVRCGGRVKCVGYYWQHEKLIPFIGRKVWFVMNDYWMQDAIVYESMYAVFICAIVLEEKMDNPQRIG